VIMSDEKQQYNIDETLDWVKFVGQVLNARSKALEDGEQQWHEAAYYIPAALTLPKAISGSGDIPSELFDLDEEEQNQMVDEIFAIIEFKDAETKAAVRKTIDSGLRFYRDSRDLTQLIIARRKAS